MAFDLTTATEDKEYKGSFDLSTAAQEEDNTGATISAYKAPTIIERVQNAWEWTTQVPVAAFMEQKKNNEAAELRTKGIYLRKIGKDLSEQEKARLQELDNPYREGKYNELNNYGIYSKFKQTDDGEYFDKGSPAVFAERTANGIKRLYADAMKQTAIYYSMIKDMSVGGALGATGGLAIGAVTTRTPQGASAGAKTGASLLARSAVAKKSFELEAGFMRQELELLNTEIAADVPLSDQEMDNLSIAVGTINAALEYVGLGAVLKTVPNGDKILGKLGKDGIKELAQDKAFREQLAQLGTRLAEAGITEGSTEAIQEYTNFVYSNLARKMKGVAPQPLAEKIDDIMYSGLVGSVCAITMGGVSTATQAASIKIKQGMDAKKAQKEAEAMTIDERNEFINENIETLAEVAIEQADNSLSALQGQSTYNRIKEEMERQGATSEVADSSAQLVQQAYNVIADKFGSEGKELLEKSNLQILINQNNKNQMVEEKNFIDNSIQTRETQTFKPSELLTDAKTFQYKEHSDADGVTERLKGVEQFDPLYAGKIIVFEALDGKRYVVDGHQRLGLAKRLGGDNIELEGFLFREADGYTPEQMRLLAAQKNIAEGSGTAIDTAKIIKEIGLENLPKTIPTNSAMVKNGMSLSKLGDTAFQKVVNGEIETNEAALVAEILRNDEAKQIAAIDYIREAKKDERKRFKNLNQVELFCNEVLATDTREITQTNLFGDFSVFQTAAVEKIRLVDRAMKSLQNDKKIFSGLLRNDSKIKGKGKNRLDKQTNERIAQQAAVAIDLIQKLASRQGIIADKANELAALVRDEKITMDEASKEFKAFVMQKDIIKDIWGKATKEIAYNQAAIGTKITSDRNIYTALEGTLESEEGIITPEEFYRKGLYQAAKAEDLANWESKYPDIAAALAEQERMKREGLLPPTIEINTDERMELRKDIAEDLYGKGAKNKNKQAYLIIGSPASGKSSMADPLQAETGSLIVDSDMAKERLPEFIESNGARADQVHLESQKIAEVVLNKALESGDNVILPIVGKSEKSIMKKYDSLTAAGYDVHLRLVYLPTEVTVDRAVNRYRATGRLVPIDYIVNEVGMKPAQNYVIMQEKGQFKSYEAISTEVEYGQKPKEITTEEIASELQKRGLRLFGNENQGRNKLVQRSDRGRSNDRIEYYQNSNFDNFFGDSKVVDEDGNPKHLWHGSVNTFEVFDKERANYEGDMGGGFYFTDNENDADGNYHAGGPDFDIKVDRLAEKIQDENEELSWEEAKEQARDELMGTPSQLEVFLRIENPCYLGKNETILFDSDEIRERAEDRIDRNDFEDEDAYEEELQYAADDVIYEMQEEASSKLYDLLSSSQIDEVRQVIADVAYEGGTNLQNLKEKLAELYLEDYETGDLVSNEVARRIVEALGYDGIIDSTVADKFNMDIEAGTTHYIAFYPEQIKSVDNLGTFDRNDPNIYHQGTADPRGLFRVDENGTAIIDILENGDASTVVHELGHFYLYSLETLAETNTRAAKELEEINKWLGKDSSKQYTADELREFHEKFARGFEAYLLEGSAPTKGLLNVFHNFKSWLRDIYNSAKDLDVEFSEAAQMLFDRVFTTDEEYEKQVLPKYQYNYAKAIELDAITSSPHYKFKKGLKEFGEKFSLWYDKLFLPIETRIGKISPALKEKLRNHTAELALIKGKDLNIAANFFSKTEAMRKNNYEDYLMFDLALKNRDEHTVKIIADRNGITAELKAVQNLLEDIYNEALGVGLDVGYLDNYYPRLVKADLTEKFIEYIESLANQERLDVINQVIKLEDAKISMILKDLTDADPSGFWGTEDRAKFINNRIRGFGKNNILLSRNASLKFERQIDELDGNFNQFYETLEPALVGYISKTRDVIEARKFFGNEIKEVGKLRARIKRKKKTLDEVEQRKPNQAKYKEIQRLKYELGPIEIKLEQLTKRAKELEDRGEELWEDQANLKDGLEKKAKHLRSQIEFVEKMHPASVKNMVKKRLRGEISEAATEIKNLIGDEANVEDSIGALITKLSADGVIYAKDERLIRDMLVARFNASSVAEPIKVIRDFSYAATLNDVTNAITQFGDLAFSVYKYGFEDTFKGLKKPFEISKEDLGLNDMAYEFGNPSMLSKWLKKQFKWIGLSAIDGLGKNAIIQASLLNAQKLAKSSNKEFVEKLIRIYGNNAEQIRKDLAEGKITDDVIIYAFHELSDIQPISEDQVTELYQSGGGYMKLFYTLKTYGIKALDVARVDITNNIIQGVKNKNKGQVKTGLQNLIRLQMLLWLFGVPIDALKDLLSNRDLNIFESMIDTLIPFFILSRYTIKDVFDSGVGTAVANFFTPPIFSTGKKALSGRASAVSHIPIIGKPLYNWFFKEK